MTDQPPVWPSKRDYDALAWLHVRGQFTYHHEALITGTRNGLTALRDALDEAIRNGSSAATVMASDGEGYAVEVRRTNGPTSMGQPPYLDEIARRIATVEQDMVRQMERRRYK